MPVVLSLPQAGSVLGAPIQACPNKGVIIVTLQYGAGADGHDADVALSAPYAQKVQNGNVFTFEITEEDAYDVVLHTPTWSVRHGYTYQGYAEPNHTTSIVVPLHVHTIQLSAQDSAWFIPQTEYVRFTYDITGDPASVARVELVAVDSGGNEVERTVVPGPYAAQATYDWQGAGRVLREAPFDVRMELVSHAGRRCQSNTRQVEIQVERVSVELDATRIAGMAGGSEKVSLQLLQQEILANRGEGRLIYESPIFSMNSAEMSANDSFTHYQAAFGAGYRVPLLARVFFRAKNNVATEAAALLAGSTFLWDVMLDLDNESDAGLRDRGVHDEARAFITTVSGRKKDVTLPTGRTAHVELLGMRASAVARGPTEQHWAQLDATWAHAIPAQRVWAGTTQGGALGGTTAASGIYFRGGRIAGDRHRIKVYLQHGVALDTTDNNAFNGVPPEQRSNILAITNWRLIPITENYWVGTGMGYFNSGQLSTEYEKAGLIIQRGSNLISGDKTVDYRTNYTQLVNASAGGSPFIQHAMLNQCGEHPAAFRPFSEYVDRSLPGLPNLPKRVAALLGSADKKQYADRCEQYAYSTLYMLIRRLFPSSVTAGVAAPVGLLLPPPAGPAGLTVLQFAGQGVHNLETDLNDGTYTAGLAPTIPNYSNRDKACFLTFNGSNVDIRTIVHEIGHHLFLAHAPGHYQQGVQPAGFQLDAHDTNQYCIMSYHRDRDGLCGLCLLKLAGYDYTRIHRDATVT